MIHKKTNKMVSITAYHSKAPTPVIEYTLRLDKAYAASGNIKAHHDNEKGIPPSLIYLIVMEIIRGNAHSPNPHNIKPNSLIASVELIRFNNFEESAIPKRLKVPTPIGPKIIQKVGVIIACGILWFMNLLIIIALNIKNNMNPIP